MYAALLPVSWFCIKKNVEIRSRAALSPDSVSAISVAPISQTIRPKPAYCVQKPHGTVPGCLFGKSNTILCKGLWGQFLTLSSIKLPRVALHSLGWSWLLWIVEQWCGRRYIFLHIDLLGEHCGAAQWGVDPVLWSRYRSVTTPSSHHHHNQGNHYCHDCFKRSIHAFVPTWLWFSTRSWLIHGFPPQSMLA